MVPMLSANPKVLAEHGSSAVPSAKTHQIAVVVAAFETVSSEAEDTAGGRPNPDGRHSIPLPETQAELKQQLQRGFVRPVRTYRVCISRRARS